MRSVLLLLGLSCAMASHAQECRDDVTHACVHPDAQVDDPATLGSGVVVFSRAQVGATASVGADSVIGVRSTVNGASGPRLTVGRRATLSAGATVGQDVVMGRSSQVAPGAVAGDRLSLGYAATLGEDALVGDDVVVGNLVTVGAGAEIADGFVVARSTMIGDGARLDGIVGPEVSVRRGVCLSPRVRVRKNAILSDYARLLEGARVGRGVLIGTGATVGAGAVIRANARVAPGAVVPENGFVARGETFTDSSGDPGAIGACVVNVTTGDDLFHHSYDNVLDPLHDDSGSGAHGAAGGGTIAFDGVDASFPGSAFYRVPGTQNADWSGGLSVAVWIRWSGSAGDYRGVVSNGYHTAGSFEIRFGREESGTRLIVSTNGPQGQRAGTLVNFPANEWHHVAIAQGTFGTLRIYLDGEYVRETTGLTWTPKSSPTPITIGYNTTFGEYYSGDVDELRVYPRELSPAEVAQLASEAH